VISGVNVLDSEFGTLKGGGDCREHYHQSDRFPSRDTMLWLQSIENVRTVTVDGPLTDKDDIIVINGSGIDLTMPPARNGRYYKFATISVNATLYPDGSETINGDTTHTVGGSHKDCRLKAITGGWIEV